MRYLNRTPRFSLPLYLSHSIPPSLSNFFLPLSLSTSLSLCHSSSFSFPFFQFCHDTSLTLRLLNKSKVHTNFTFLCSMIGSRLDFALLVEAVSPFTPTLGRGRHLTAMASSSTPKSTSEERFAELFPLVAEENARLRGLFQPSGVIVEGVSHREHDPPSKWGTVWSQRSMLLPTKAAVLEPPPKKAAVLEPPPKAMTGGQWLGPPPPETQVLPEGSKPPPPKSKQVPSKVPPPQNPTPTAAVEAKEAPAEWLQAAASAEVANLA